MSGTRWCVRKQPSAPKQHWLCGACGDEYKHAVVEGVDIDARGQSAPYNYTIFIKVTWASGDRKIFIARVPQPNEHQMNVFGAMPITMGAKGRSLIQI